MIDPNAEKAALMKWANKFCLFKVAMYIVMSTAFQVLVFLFIIANTIVLCLDRYPIGDSEVKIHSILNEIFTWFFVFEMVIKMTGMGIVNYCRDRFNMFDAFIVAMSLFEFTINQLNFGEGVSTGGAITAFRGIRLLRIFKLARSWKSF